MVRPEYACPAMAIAEVDISMPVDGFVTGPGLSTWPRAELGRGRGNLMERFEF